MNAADLQQIEHYGAIVAYVVVPTLVTVSHPLARWARSVDGWARKSPAKWDDKPARALRWLLVGFAANADRASRFVAALLPMAQAAREAMRGASTPGLEREQQDERDYGGAQ